MRIGRPLDAGDELPRESRLADAGGAEHGDEVRALSRTARANVLCEQLELFLAADERHRTTSRRPTSSETETTRHASTPSGKPRAACAPSGSSTTVRRVSRSTSGPSRISPGSAACCSRAAALIATPVANVVSVSSERISPVSMPMRTSRPSSPTASTIAERRPHGALRVVLVRERHAERGHHGVAGELLDDPAVRRDAMRRPDRRTASARERTTSGSALATSCVDPTRSTKSTVASFRSIPEG